MMPTDTAAVDASGKLGGAVSLNGTDGYVSLSFDSMIDICDFTIATWVFWNSARTEDRVFDFGSNRRCCINRV